MMKRRLTASIVSFALFFTTAFCGLSVPVYADEVPAKDLPEVTVEDLTFNRDSETGHISIEEDDLAAYEGSYKSEKITPNGALPSVYGGFKDIKAKYPNVRNQNPYGTCWAFAATACAEFDMVTDGDATKSNADYSELQLAWFNYHKGYETLGLNGDNVYVPSGASKSYLDVGGNFYYSMHTLAQWKCYTYEKSLPYSNVVNNESYTVAPSTSLYHNAAQLTDVRMLDIKNNPSAVKQAIIDNGAVYISYHHDSSNYSLNGYSLYYNPNDDGTNHDVVIVGWDDTIPASKWPAGKRPSSNGGWLVRNSWTTDQSVGSEYSYFYMSYEDASLANTAYSIEFEPYSANDNIYQYDGSTTHAYVYTSSVANVFTANTSMDNNSEKLDSVMIPFMGDTNVNYKIEVYTGLTSSDLTSGYKHVGATTTGWTTTKGIYTIPLNNPVYLRSGEKFAVVVTALNGNANFEIEISENVTYFNNGVEDEWFSTVAHADAGESFVYSNGSWVDAINYDVYNWFSYDYGNICIKALTVDSSTRKYNITYNLNGGTNSKNNPGGFTSYDSDITLASPTRSGYDFIGWYTDSSFKNKVTTIDTAGTSNVTLYAKWCNHSSRTSNVIAATLSADGQIQNKCAGCGKLISTSTIYRPATVQYHNYKYDGAKKTAVLVIKDSQGNILKEGTDYTLGNTTATAVGKQITYIYFKGKYTGTAYTNWYILPNAPKTVSSKLIGYKAVKVTWSKSTGATGYNVYYKYGNNTYKLLTSTTKTSASVKNLTGGKKYYFKVVPYYTVDGSRLSIAYKTTSIYTLKKIAAPKVTRNGKKVKIKWTNINGETGYQIQKMRYVNGKYKVVNTYNSTAAYKNVTATKGKKYYYRVRAYKKVGTTKYYAPWSAKTKFTR